jgi:hypothetical protein
MLHQGGGDRYGGGAQSYSNMQSPDRNRYAGQQGRDPYASQYGDDAYGGTRGGAHADGGGYGAPPPPPPPSSYDRNQYGGQSMDRRGQYEERAYGSGNEYDSYGRHNSPERGSYNSPMGGSYGHQEPVQDRYGSPSHHSNYSGGSFGYGDSREFFVNLHLDEHDRGMHAKLAAKEKGRQMAGSAGHMFGAMMGTVTGGAVVSDKALADMVADATDEAIMLVMRRQRWQVRTSLVMMPPESGYSEWKSYMKLDSRQGGLMMAFRVQVVQRLKEDPFYPSHQRGFFDCFSSCREGICPPEPPAYNRRTAHKVGPEIQDVLQKRHPPIHAYVDIADANEEVHALQEMNIPQDVAEHVVTASRGVGYGSPQSATGYGGGRDYSPHYSSEVAGRHGGMGSSPGGMGYNNDHRYR